MSGVERQMIGSCGSTEHVLSTVLQLVVQHADVRPAEVARWLRLSKGIRRALQHAAGNLKVTMAYAPFEKLTAVAHWLPSHAGLVSSLRLCGPFSADRNSALWTATEQVLSFALQLSSSRSPPSSTNPQNAPAPALQLKSFDTDIVCQPAALHCLAGSSCLTELTLGAVPPHRFTAVLCAALGQMRALRKLSCWVEDPSAPQAACSFPPQFAAALAALTQLQELAVDSLVPAAGLRDLPGSLTSLILHTHHSGDPATAGRRTQISIIHLTKLESYLTAPDGVSAQSQLPACLKSLVLQVGSAEAVPGLFELQHLELCQTHEALPFLQRVAQQARLQRLDLASHTCSRQQLQQVFSALSSCTQLTQLHLFNREAEPHDRDSSVNLSGIQVHMQLSKLRQLQRLQLTQIKWDLWGPSQLTVLSALTQLKLEYCDMSDMGLAVMFQRLTGLRELEVAETLPDNELLLVTMGCLSNLEYLESRYNEFSLTDETLPLLLPLTKLTALALFGANDSSTVSPSAERAFLAGMPHLTEIYWE